MTETKSTFGIVWSWAANVIRASIAWTLANDSETPLTYDYIKQCEIQMGQNEYIASITFSALPNKRLNQVRKGFVYVFKRSFRAELDDDGSMLISLHGSSTASQTMIARRLKVAGQFMELFDPNKVGIVAPYTTHDRIKRTVAKAIGTMSPEGCPPDVQNAIAAWKQVLDNRENA